MIINHYIWELCNKASAEIKVSCKGSLITIQFDGQNLLKELEDARIVEHGSLEVHRKVILVIE